MKTAEERIADALAYIGEDYAPGSYMAGLREILQPPPKRYTLGGVLYEEAGKGTPRNNEWFRLPGFGSPTIWRNGDPSACYSEVVILRPVEIVGAE